jgi:hypothetical protein
MFSYPAQWYDTISLSMKDYGAEPAKLTGFIRAYCRYHNPSLCNGGICWRQLRRVDGLPLGCGSACNHSARMSGQ